MNYTRENHYIAAYLRRHIDIIRGWTREGTMQWVRWFINHGRSLSIYSKGQLVGVTLVRCVDTKEEAEANYVDTGGVMAYIEVTACEKGHMPYLFTLLRQTFPKLQKMAWCRSKHHNRPFITTIEKAEAHLA